MKDQNVWLWVIGIAIISTLVYTSFMAGGREVATVRVVDDQGRTLYTEDLKADSPLQTQAVGKNSKRQRISEPLQQAIESPGATGMYVTLHFTNNGNLPINITLNDALLMGGFK